jgi:hypothetical protein
MANPSISLTNYDQQLAEVKRRQALAQMLQEQANAPIDIQSYKGVQAAIPWTAVLAKALQGGVAAHQARKAEKQQGELTQQARQQAVDFLRNMTSQVPNVQASQPMRTEQVAAPMSAPGLQTPQQLMAGGVQGMAQRMAAPPQSPIAAPPAAAPQSISVPDATPQPAMIDRRATDRQQMALEGMVSANPFVQPMAGQMYEQATKDISKEKMADAISKVDIGDADPAVMKLYLSSDNPEGAIDYLSKYGIAKAEAQAKLEEIKLRAAENAEQQEANRELRRDIADQSSADRRAMAAQSSADRRFAAGLSQADRQAAREDRLSQLTYLQQSELMGIVKSHNAVDTAIAAVKTTPGAFSAARGAATRMGPLGESLAARGDTPEQRDARAQVFNVMSSVIKERAGTAQSKAELATLNSFLPNPYDTAPIIENKLTGFKRYLAAQEKAVMSVGRNGVEQPAAGKADPLGLR